MPLEPFLGKGVETSVVVVAAVAAAAAAVVELAP